MTRDRRGQDEGADDTAVQEAEPANTPSGLEATLAPTVPVAAGPRAPAKPADDGDYPELTAVDPRHYIVGKQLARGGMGRILVARDRRLGREVALKELLHPDPELWRRFEREARITAGLQHPGIVSLHEAGRWPTGVPFYAMKLVAGRPFDQVIGGAATLRDRLALLPNVIAAADALAYAHSRRVIHRDLKPANVLVGDFGETVVIDWGLAKDLGDPTAASDVTAGPYRTGPATGETVAGSVMGTPAYMPPEQARGDAVDERADVYALGAILYQVMCGEPPYQARGMDELLAKVVAGPPQPLAERVAGVPSDLATIVDKAMARRAEDRYPTAQALTLDLKQFQTGQLVGAHSYSAWQLVRRFVARHRAAVSVAAVLASVFAVSLALSFRRIVRERRTADEQRTLALASRGQAEDLMSFMLVDLREKLLPLGKLELLDAVARKAIAYYQRPGGADSDEDRRKRAIAHVSIGDVLAPRGDLPGALEQYRTALAERAELAAKDPKNDTWQGDLAEAHERVADTLAAQGEIGGALDAYRAELAVREPLSARRPGDGATLYGLVKCAARTGDVLKSRGELDAALAQYRRADESALRLAALDARNETWQNAVVVTHGDLAEGLLAKGDTTGALVLLRGARDVLARMDPSDTLWRRNLSATDNEIGLVLEMQSDRAAALATYRDSLAIMEELVRRDPSNAGWQLDVSITQGLLGNALFAQGDDAGALAAFGAGATILGKLAAQDATNEEWRRGLAIADRHLGDVEHRQGREDAALVHYRAALVIDEELAAKHPDSALLQADRALGHGRVGTALLHRDIAAAMVEARTVLDIRARLAARDPKNLDWQHDLAIAHDKLADVLAATGDEPGRLAECRESLAIRERVAAADGANAERRWYVAISHENIGNALLERKHPDVAAARAEFEQALAISSALLEKDPTDLDLRLHVASLHEHLGDTAALAGDRARARAEYKDALDRAEALAKVQPRQRRARQAAGAAARGASSLELKEARPARARLSNG